jgi:large subunit ribosomal protein L21
MSYAIISVGGKQYRVSEGQKLLVDRLSREAGKTFTPDVLLVGGGGETQLSPKGITVTARVVEHVLGDKVRIGKYRPKTGYRRHAGHRSRLSRIEIQSIGTKGARTTRQPREAAADEAKPRTRRKAEPAAAEETRATSKGSAADAAAKVPPVKQKATTKKKEEA